MIEIVVDLGSKFLMTLLPAIALLYIWHILLEKSFNFKKISNYIIVMLLIIITILNYFFVNEYIKIVSINIVCIIVIYLIFERNIYKAIITSIYGYLILLIAELIFAMIVLGIFKIDGETAINNFFGTILTNGCISIISIILIKIPIFKILYNKLLNLMEKVLDIYVLELLFIIMLFFNFYLSLPYYNTKLEYSILIHMSFLILCIFIFLSYCHNKNKYLKTNDKYNTTLNSLREYEDLVSLYRINNHENKNQLMTIRGMIQKQNKQAVNYIDQIVNNQLKDNERVLNKVNRIPEGGLRGLIYAKLLSMDSKKIKYKLTISREIKASDLIKIGDNTLLDVCKITGVFLDNAIEYVGGIKEKEVSIQLYKDNDRIVIEIANRLEDDIDLDKISNVGYTTKGKDHGYGLSLVDKLIRGNKQLTNKKKINDDYFTQLLEVKI